MDYLPFLFLILLSVVGGFVGLAGDELGRRLGKKRLTVLGLRPRHTAKFGTFLLGVVISFITIAAVGILSSGVRQWILEGRVAIERAKQMQGELHSAEAQLIQSQSELRADQLQILGKNREIQAGNRQLGSQGRLLARQQQELGSLDSRRRALAANLDRTTAQLRSTSGQLKDKGLQITLTEAKLGKSEQKLSTVEGQLKTVGEQLKVATNAYNQGLQEKLTLDMQAQDLRKQISDQKGELATLQSQKELLQTEKDALSKDLDQDRQELVQAGHDLEAIRQAAGTQYEFLRSTFAPSRFGAMIYAYRQEVTRLTVEPNLSRDQAADALETLLRQARVEAQTRGAKEHPGYKVADVFDHMDDNGTTIPAEQIKANIVDQLTGKPDTQVLIANCDLNTFEGEPVALDPKVEANPLVFQRGEIVASSNIDGGQDESRIYQQISSFLGERVRDTAQARHMIPRANSDMPFGAVPGNEVFKTIQAIKSVGRPVRLQAIALKATRAADQLDLDLQIK